MRRLPYRSIPTKTSAAYRDSVILVYAERVGPRDLTKATTIIIAVI